MCSLAAEVVQHLIVREAAAVEAHVQDDGFLVEVVGVERPHKAIQAVLVHARECGCSRACPCSARPRGGRCCPPSARTSARRSVLRLDAWHLDARAVPLASRVGGSAVTCSDDRFADLAVEQLAQVGASVDLDAVDADDEVARLEVQAALVGGAALQHLGDLQALAAIGFVEDQAQVGGRLLRRVADPLTPRCEAFSSPIIR